MRNHRISFAGYRYACWRDKNDGEPLHPLAPKSRRGNRRAYCADHGGTNYIPNRAPVMLLNAKLHLGVLIPSFQNQLFADILPGLNP